MIYVCTSTPEILKTVAYKRPHLKAQVKALKSFTLSMRLTQTNLILCSQDETAVSYSKLLLSLSNFEINYPFKNNLLLVHFELASKFFQQWKCSLKLKYAIANSYFFTIFRGSMPPFPLRMVIPTASHLKVKMQMKISDMKVAKGCGFYRIVCVLPAPFDF